MLQLKLILVGCTECFHPVRRSALFDGACVIPETGALYGWTPQSPDNASYHEHNDCRSDTNNDTFVRVFMWLMPGFRLRGGCLDLLFLFHSFPIVAH